MVRKVSEESMSRLRSEDSTRVLTKSRAAPSKPDIEEKVAAKSEPVNLAPIVDAMEKQNQELVVAIKSMQPPVQQIPPKVSGVTITNIKRNSKDQISSVDFNVKHDSSGSAPTINRIHVDNISRKDDRIKSVDLSVNYEEVH